MALWQGAVTLSGKVGGDAKRYQEQEVAQRIAGARAAKVRSDMKRGKKATGRECLRVVEWSPEDRCFVGSAPLLVGRCCHGPTEANVLRQLKRIVDDWIRLADSEDVRLPAPERSSAYSGRFLLRVPAPVHQKVATC
jgi:predicted RNase H-like HicB family nuclease